VRTTVTPPAPATEHNILRTRTKRRWGSVVGACGGGVAGGPWAPARAPTGPVHRRVSCVALYFLLHVFSHAPLPRTPSRPASALLLLCAVVSWLNHFSTLLIVTASDGFACSPHPPRAAPRTPSPFQMAFTMDLVAFLGLCKLRRIGTVERSTFPLPLSRRLGHPVWVPVCFCHISVVARRERLPPPPLTSASAPSPMQMHPSLP
jgi:hypothetical protein